MRTLILGILLALASIPAHAQQQAEHDHLHADVWERILTRLEELPERWDRLPDPVMAPSGQLPEQVLDAATESERAAAAALLSRLVLTPIETRARVLAEVQSQHALSEVAVWWPLHLARQQRLSSYDEAALTLDAWLELAEHLGRRDVLLRAAGAALELADRRFPPARLATVAKRWSTLPPGPHGTHGVASVNRAYGRILLRSGQHREALEAYRTAKQLYLAIGDQLGQGYSWIGEADVLSFLPRNNDDALAAYRQARALFSAMGDKIGQALSWYGEGSQVFFRGQFHRALAAYRQARTLFASVGDLLGQGRCWIGEAEVLQFLGQYDGALAAHRQARALYSALGDQLGQGNSWNDEAEVLYMLGQRDSALTAYRQARSLHAAVGNQIGQGRSWLGEAEVLFRWLGQHEGALAAYRQARAFYTSWGEQRGQGNCWNGEATVLFVLGQPDDALAAYRRARALLAAVGDPLGQARSWYGEAEVLFDLDDLGPALHAAEKAIRLAKNVNGINTELAARVLEARILVASKQESRAIRQAEHALAILRRLRQRGVSDFDRTAISVFEVPHDILIPLLARQRGLAVEKALALAEEAHAPVLLDLLVTGSRRPDVTGDSSLLEERERVHHRLAQIDRELQDVLAPDQREKLLRDRAALDAQLERNELVAVSSLESNIVNGAPIDARTRKALVREVGPILLYYVAEEETVAFLLRSGQHTPLVRRLGLSRSQIEREVRTLRYDLANSPLTQGSRKRQRTLFDQLVAPFADALAGAPRLTIIPHGPLHELPFEAMLDANDVPLFERWHLTIAPSLSVLHILRQRGAGRQPLESESAFLGIAGGTGLSLPYREVSDASAWFGPTARIIAQQSNSRGTYTELAPGARHILISSHGKHVAKSRSGYLELSGPGGVATRLTASDIARIPLRAELVTLAACETARGEALQSDERLDLTRAFLIAGADAVLATRWRVPEHPSTQQFLLDFYQALHQGGTRLRKDEALTEARRRSLARGDQAQLWAAWVLVGDAR
jgi:CHAT domain-containing protein